MLVIPSFAVVSCQSVMFKVENRHDLFFVVWTSIADETWDFIEHAAREIVIADAAIIVDYSSARIFRSSRCSRVGSSSLTVRLDVRGMVRQ